jgi:prepilin-type N-terminal cleavage/methylation domain-containing protein
MRAHSHKLGFTLVELMIVVGIIAMLIMIAVPGFMRYRESSQRTLCKQNVEKIEAAKQLWGLESGKAAGDTPLPDELYGPNGYIRAKATCPGTGQDYLIKALGQTAQCQFPAHQVP